MTSASQAAVDMITDAAVEDRDAKEEEKTEELIQIGSSQEETK